MNIRSGFRALGLSILGLVVVMALTGCNDSARRPPSATPPVIPPTANSANPPPTHADLVGRAKTTAMSGSPTLPQLIEIGADYRGEIVLEKKGAIKLLTLERDAATIKEVDIQ